jgi:hypothetical protein
MRFQHEVTVIEKPVRYVSLTIRPHRLQREVEMYPEIPPRPPTYRTMGEKVLLYTLAAYGAVCAFDKLLSLFAKLATSSF